MSISFALTERWFRRGKRLFRCLFQGEKVIQLAEWPGENEPFILLPPDRFDFRRVIEIEKPTALLVVDNRRKA